MNRQVDVYLSMPSNRGGGTEDVLVGRAYFAVGSRGVSTTFRYDSTYLARRDAFALDPALGLFVGQLSVGDGLPYAFSDCAPDRWGRNLIRKRLRGDDVRAGRTARTVTDVDFLLGVTDLTRQGALRFTEPGAGSDGPYLSSDPHVPRLLELPRLMRAAERVELDDDSLDAVKELLDAGTGSLGGARPKASVRDGERLLVAKFSSPSDEWDVIGWEKTALDLAERAGLRVPRRTLTRVDGKHVLLLDRFDRDGTGRRIPYISAMSLMEARDGTSQELDYIDVAEALAEQGSTSIRADLVELWERVAFSVAIHNTDDHLRNHGFVRDGGGWTVSPIFDVNPNPDASASRQTGIGTARARVDELDGLWAAAPAFGLDMSSARERLRAIRDVTGPWRDVATSNGVPLRELDLMAEAFEGLASL